MAGESERTGLEQQEDEAEATWGKAGPLGGMNDHVLLTMDDVNRVTVDSHQSELMIHNRRIHNTLVYLDNIEPHYIDRIDPETKQAYKERIIIDNWRWMLDRDYMVRTNQLSYKGLARQEYRDNNAALLAIAPESPGEGSLFDKIKGWLGR